MSPSGCLQVAVAMFGYMTDLETVDVVRTEEVTAQGDDLESLLFHFLDEFLFLFSAEPFFVPKVAPLASVQSETSVVRHPARSKVNLTLSGLILTYTVHLVLCTQVGAT